MTAVPHRVLVVNDTSSGVTPENYKYAQKVFVVNLPASGNPVDTFTKTEIEERFSALQQRYDALSKTVADTDGTYMPKETRAWIERTMIGMVRKMKEFELIFFELCDDYFNFKSMVTEDDPMEEHKDIAMNPKKHARISIEDKEITEILQTLSESQNTNS